MASVTEDVLIPATSGIYADQINDMLGFDVTTSYSSSVDAPFVPDMLTVK
jgi:hypothetical protein